MKKIFMQLALITVLLGGFAVFFAGPGPASHNKDFRVLHFAGQLLATGRSPYVFPSAQKTLDQQASPGKPASIENLNPPLLNVIFIPFAKLAVHSAEIAWTTLSMLALLLSVYFITAGVGRGFFQRDLGWLAWPASIQGLILLFMMMLSGSTLNNLMAGQVGLLIMAGTMWAWWLDRQPDHPGLAPVIMGVLTLMKPFLLGFAGYYVLQSWKKLLWYCSGIILGVCVSLLWVKMSFYLDYWQVLQQTVTQHMQAKWLLDFNGSLASLCQVMLQRFHVSSPAIWWSYLGIMLVCVAIFITDILRLFRLKVVGRYDLGFAYTLVVVLWLCPLSWQYYYGLLLLPICLFVPRYMLSNQAVNRVVVIVVMLICVLIPAREGALMAEYLRPQAWALGSWLSSLRLPIGMGLLWWVSHQALMCPQIVVMHSAQIRLRWAIGGAYGVTAMAIFYMVKGALIGH